MEWRINALESEVRRVRAELEKLKTDLERRRDAMRNRAYIAVYWVTNAILLGALWHGFGWI